jgi:predicted RNA binding protein YcfA (HicA-like mRNA interferase family)
VPTLGDILQMLERDDALEIGAAPDIWPTLDPDADVYELDWQRLFPRRPLDRGEEAWELYADDDWVIPESLVDAVSGGSDELVRRPEPSTTTPPGWDRCAWYQPIHFHGMQWGIFLYDTCIIDVAKVLYLMLGCPPLTDPLVKALLRSGFATLFLHEQYHHKTESLGLRLHVVERTPRYVPYFRGVYVKAAGSDDQIEEGLANADSYHRLDDEPYRTWLSKPLKELTKKHLRASFSLAPPGYRRAVDLLTLPDFDRTENVLEAQVQEGRLKPKRSTTADFSVATHLNQSLFTIRQHIWVVVPKGGVPLLPVRPRWVVPTSRVSLEKILKSMGYRLEPGRGKGSHRYFTRVGSQPIVLPNGKDLSPVVLRNTAHALGLKNARELLGLS